jgi:ribonucleoside-diphosphate reductase alpha chain
MCGYFDELIPFCDNPEVGEDKCQMNTCPIWKNLQEHLPAERVGKTRKVEFTQDGSKKDIYITTSTYDDGQLGEVFLDIGKEGDEDAVYGLFFTAISMALQRGVPLRVFTDKFMYQRVGSPILTMNDGDIPAANSIVDYIFRRLDLDYGKRPEPAGTKGTCVCGEKK